MKRFLLVTLSLMVFGAIVLAGGTFLVLNHYGRELPDYAQLADYEPPVTTRVHAGDGRLMAEYATQNRLFVPIEFISEPVIHAFLAAEDKNFFKHPGIDVVGISRALITNVFRVAAGRRPVGGSTITQQVAKNFLLTNEVSIDRKIKEALLAFRIERALSKERILELYLNEIYLGFGSYGVAAAALNYFNKSIDDLTLAEAAFLAALPKAPSNYNPLRYPQAAKDRRDWVISRMLDDGRITREVADFAWAEPLVVRRRDETEYVTAPWFAEEVRREIAERFGEGALYGGGLSVRATLDPRLQRIADETLRAGLIAYDRKHGWRGPITRISASANWANSLRAVPAPPALGDWQLAVVTDVGGQSATIAFADGRTGTIPMSEMKWARPWREGERVGPAPNRPADVLSVGDVVPVERVKGGEGSTGYALRQIPAVDGALVAIDPHTGRVLAVTGGYSPDRSQFNRATQARRQPGSAFKPFVYLAALERGYTPATMILDAAIEINQGPGLPVWRPKNYSGQFYGPATMRTGLEKSRNLMTVRMANTVGVGQVAKYAERFGVFAHMPRVLSMALGAGETTLLRLTAAYGMIANGGKHIEATLIDRVQDRTGQTIHRHDQRLCELCSGSEATAQRVPEPDGKREQLADPVSVYQMISMLQGVVERGTGTGVKIPGKPLAGKTGTTNDSLDTWFVGFSSSLVAGVFVGFDAPKTLGPGETGSSVAAPIFKDFMEDALEYFPATPFPVPQGVRLVRISRSSGLLAEPGAGDVILEAFKPGTEPRYAAPVVGEDTYQVSSDPLPPGYGYPGAYSSSYPGAYSSSYPGAYPSGYPAPGYPPSRYESRYPASGSPSGEAGPAPPPSYGGGSAPTTAGSPGDGAPASSQPPVTPVPVRSTPPSLTGIY